MCAAYSVAFERAPSKPAARPTRGASNATAPTRASINRSNAQHSTGPQTEEGKRRAALNAIKHGLTARTVLLPTEDLATFDRHVQQFLDEYNRPRPPKTTSSTNSPTPLGV